MEIDQNTSTMPHPEGMPPWTNDSFAAYREIGCKAVAGRYSYGAPRLLFNAGDDTAVLDIGSFCSIAEGVSIFIGHFGRHWIDFATSYPIMMVFGSSHIKKASRVIQGDLSVTIGSDVWIGQGATILAGVKIGDGAAIGMGAIVTKDVPPYAIVGGAPARVINYRFPELIIARLVAIRWWEWNDDLLSKNMDLFAEPLNDELMDRFEAAALENQINV
jgi:acetyltransferase-like isoleucine patch superfamily enzyme